ncbi:MULTISPECIES: NADPH-dependent FMN reductase [unclassified Micromonospora]|uniref:NADPH-dependent FMN reductase n=1 Tax=unclassified Micromonospora TaxID=2617518 RepID=UPI00104B9D71|nr:MULTISPECIES: NAD(P)H-dependent oxidoreductase [unclassified Micromonospora]TDB80616.1 NADPH-dependent oxidoreductase [Micromonospora sp. KC721]TDC42864.1 NADPH-dependent oxidoreductase [Micromonospora sp. KC213]
MSQGPLRIAVIVASTREGRFAETVSRWLVNHAEQYDIELDVIDLAHTPLPPVLRATPTPEVSALAARIGAADGFIVVTCEYNHGYPASLKLAIDSVFDEWHAKPVAFVSYGGMAGGLRAVEQLRQVFAELHMVTVRETVSFHMAPMQFDEQGAPKQAEAVNTAAKALLDQLLWWAGVLREARGRVPYPA